MAPAQERVAATLYVREELPRPARERAEAVRTSLQAVAEADGPVDEFERREWPKRVPVDECDSAVRDTYLAFSAWAEDAGKSLAPFFATRECYSPEAEAHTDWLVVPAFVLAVRVDGRLEAVYPHSDGEATATVEDGVAMLRSMGEEPANADVVLAGGETV